MANGRLEFITGDMLRIRTGKYKNTLNDKNNLEFLRLKMFKYRDSISHFWNFNLNYLYFTGMLCYLLGYNVDKVS